VLPKVLALDTGIAFSYQERRQLPTSCSVKSQNDYILVKKKLEIIWEKEVVAKHKALLHHSFEQPGENICGFYLQ
jgi:hypothetical protein